MMAEKFEEGQRFLASNGYNMLSVAAVESLPKEAMGIIEGNIPNFSKYKSLICIASFGRSMWQAMAKIDLDEKDPVDVFTANIMKKFVENYLCGSETATLFPHTEFCFGVQCLGEWLKWVHPSPLGIGISNQYGLWGAYRSVFLTTLELPETPREINPSPCDACEEKPCISVCPAGAVKQSYHQMNTFDVKSCAEFRVQEKSICALQCIARLACPVGREHQYTKAQLSHHYGKSLPKMASYLERLAVGQ